MGPKKLSQIIKLLHGCPKYVCALFFTKNYWSLLTSTNLSRPHDAAKLLLMAIFKEKKWWKNIL